MTPCILLPTYIRTRRNHVADAGNGHADAGNGHGVDGGHGDGRGHEQARLQRIFCVAITEGATSYWVGLKWDTFLALVRPPDHDQGS